MTRPTLLQLAKRDTDPIMSLELPNIPLHSPLPKRSSILFSAPLPPTLHDFHPREKRSAPLRATQRPSPRFVIVFMVFQRELEG